MAYCRWSSDDFLCDVYTYEDVNGGWTTRVARNRATFDRANLPEDPMERFLEVDRRVDGAVRVPLNLKYDGESFNDPTAGECAERLEWLRSEGYNVPQYAIDELRAEQDETDKLASEVGRD